MDSLHHSAAVHMPLALAVLFPVLYAMIGILIAFGKLPKFSWAILFFLGLLQLLSLKISLSSGIHDRMLSSASIDQLDNHRELATQFSYIWLVVTFILPIGFLSPRWLARVAHVLIFALLVTQLIWAIKTGETGGHIVFG